MRISKDLGVHGTDSTVIIWPRSRFAHKLNQAEAKSRFDSFREARSVCPAELLGWSEHDHEFQPPTFREGPLHISPRNVVSAYPESCGMRVGGLSLLLSKNKDDRGTFLFVWHSSPSISHFNSFWKNIWWQNDPFTSLSYMCPFLTRGFNICVAIKSDCNDTLY